MRLNEHNLSTGELRCAHFHTGELPSEYLRSDGHYRAVMSGVSDYDFTSGPGFAYVKIADHVAGEIASGRLPVGARLMGEREMAEHYGVSVPTIQRALKVLRSRGLVETWHGRGTYVSESVGEETEPEPGD